MKKIQEKRGEIYWEIELENTDKGCFFDFNLLKINFLSKN